MAEKDVGGATPPGSPKREDVPAPDQRLQRCLEGHHEPQTAEITWTTAHNEPAVLAETVYCTVLAKILAEPQKEKPRG